MEKSLKYSRAKKEVSFVNQLKLPLVSEKVRCKTFDDMREAIASMKLRGAPLIGVSGAFGLLLWAFSAAKTFGDSQVKEFMAALSEKSEEMIKTRPTAVNLKWACDRVVDRIKKVRPKSVSEAIEALEALCVKMDEEDIKICEMIGYHGSNYFCQKFFRREKTEKKLRILTHCNAGALATCGYGTALGVIRSCHSLGILDHAIADETRPYLQGARITAYELSQDNIPYYLICDNMAGWLMKKGEIDIVITGADRIALNGDAANKIGTYSLSILARENNVPMFIAAPVSTFDFSIKSGRDIIIEERNGDEVSNMHGVRIAPDGVKVKNPAFDVTSAENIAGIITEAGLIHSPRGKNMKDEIEKLKNNI